MLTTGFQFLRDLSPLAATTIDDLGLQLVSSELATLAGTGIRRLTIRDPRIGGEAGLGALPADLPLRDLVVDNLPRSRNLLGVERWPSLARVACRGVPRAEELDALALLPALDHLVITSPEVPDPSDPPGDSGWPEALAAFPALRRVDLDDVAAPASPAWSAVAAVLVAAGIEVRVDGRPPPRLIVD